ncbi:MAG: PEP-CTERM sorting domain-containing protein [Bryobacteraceae bacterium]
MKKTLMFLAAGLLVALPSAYGTVLNPGDSGVTPDVFSNISNYTLMNSTSGTGTFKTLAFSYNAYVAADQNNTFCAGCLDFAYVVTNTGTDNIDLISTGSFAGWKTDVGYYNGQPGLPPDSVSRNSGTGAAINFNYIPTELTTGNSSAYLVIETNTHWYTDGTITAQDGVSANGLVPVFAPAIPEPMSMGLLGGGLALLGLLGMRRRKAVKL